MFEKEAEEYSNNWKINKNNDLNFAELVELRAVIYKANKDGAEFGYNKANEWHNLKTEKPPLRKEVLWCIDNKLWLGQLCESWIDFDEWDIDSVSFNDYEIAWKEIVLPELKESKSI